ncbi:MAG: hypothetical protein ABIR37_05005 [Candidatus Saccharimonadales bacterium]
MSEVVYDQYDFDERERLTFADILNRLKDSPDHLGVRIDLVSEQSGLDVLGQMMNEGSLSDWTDDILDAFRIDKTRWSDHVIDPETLRTIEPEKAARLRYDLGDTLRTFTLEQLTKSAVEGHGKGEAAITLRLNDTIHVDLCGAGSVWVDPGSVSSELTFSALFRRVAKL